VCAASLGEILYLDHFSGSCGFVYAYLGQNHGLLSPAFTDLVFESTNYEHENTGTGHNF
jgi:hypothetical protein